jgi:SH3 domain protein
MTSMQAGCFAGPGRALVCALAIGLAGLMAEPARAASAWVKGEVRLNVRTGPSNEYRILSELHTGDKVDVLENGEGWTRIRSGDREGWVPEGFLQNEPPASALLADAQGKASELSGRVTALEAQTAKLGEENQSFSQRDASQRKEIETLTRENLELNAGAAWPERIVGAGILGTGMLIGWVIHVFSSRRQRTPRIRL